MADIELVIKIDEEDFEIMKHNIAVNNPLCPLSQEEMVYKIANGIPLPEGHGKLIDVSDIEWAKHREERNYIDYEVIDWDDIINAPTIIEAEESQESLLSINDVSLADYVKENYIDVKEVK